jgi:hypothetical protein
MLVSSTAYKNVLKPIVSVQKKQYPVLFKAESNPAKLGAKDKFIVTPLITIVPVPQDKSAVVISHEYFVVALIEYTLD